MREPPTENGTHEASTVMISAAERRALERARDAALSDPRFVAAPRVSALLAHLVARTLDGEDGPLDAVRVSKEVLGRALEGDPRHDPALRVLIARLRLLLDERCARIVDEPVLRLPPGTHRLVVERGRRTLDERRCDEPSDDDAQHTER